MQTISNPQHSVVIEGDLEYFLGFRGFIAFSRLNTSYESPLPQVNRI